MASNSADPVVLSDADFMPQNINVSQTPSQNNATLTDADFMPQSSDFGFGHQIQKMQQPLPDRPSPLMSAVNAITSLPAGGALHPIETAMAAGKVMAAPIQAAESFIANKALRAQQASGNEPNQLMAVAKGYGSMLNPMTTPGDIYQGVVGPQKTMGDVNYRAGLNHPLANAAGLAQTMIAAAPEETANLVESIKNPAQAIEQLQAILTNRLPRSEGEKFLMALQNKTEPGANLSNELSAQADEARKVVGATQGGYINANASAAVNGDKLNQIVSDLPKALQEDILSHPEISKSPKPYVVTDATGNQIINQSEPTIDPTLKNAETIRGIIKGRVPASKWNIKTVDQPTANLASQGYDEIGKIMKEGRPELADAMKQYGEVSNAQKQIAGRLATKTGMTKSNPILKMFGENADNADLQAISKLAEENPDILNTLAKIKKLSTQVERTKAFKLFLNEWGKKAAEVTGIGGLLKYIR